MKPFLEKLMSKKSLTEEECAQAMGKIDAGASEAQIGAFLALLHAKGETLEEMLGLVRYLRKKAKPFCVPHPILDIVGTGGDGMGTINISTGSAILAARCGVFVVKHGNRAVSSQCGSADVLEALGFSFEKTKEAFFSFCFAPDHHPILQKVKTARRELKIPTTFNLLGPLLNPASVDHLMIGVFSPKYVELMAKTLFALGTKRSLVFHSHGLDELSCLGPADALLVTENGIESLRIDPENLGLKRCAMADLQGGSACDNAMRIGAALAGASPLSDTLILNAGVGLYLYGAAATIEEGILKVRKSMCKKSLKKALRQNRPAVLAEIKKASPSKGSIGTIEHPADRALQYVKGGAAAISVLTNAAFEGSLEDLRTVAQAFADVDVPILRKDFIVDPIQIAQAAAAGADAVLLIASRLKERTQEMLAVAKRMGLEAIVEVHSEEDFAYISDAEIVGVNQRDLKDFSMHPDCFAKLIGKIPKEVVKLAESGIKNGEDAKAVFQLGFDAVLMGEALTCAKEPIPFITRLKKSCL